MFPELGCSNYCTKCFGLFSNMHIVTKRKRTSDEIYCKKCLQEKDSEIKRLKVMLDVIPTHILPRNIIDDYKVQKSMDYEFLCRDGSIHVSQLALDFSDFYNDMCKGSCLSYFFTLIFMSHISRIDIISKLSNRQKPNRNSIKQLSTTKFSQKMLCRFSPIHFMDFKFG